MMRRVGIWLVILLAILIAMLLSARRRNPPPPLAGPPPEVKDLATRPSVAVQPTVSPIGTSVTVDRAARIARIERDYADLVDKWRQPRNEGPASREQWLARARELALLRQAWRTDLAPLLSAAELEAFEMDVLPVGDSVRQGLVGSTASDAQWRGVFRALDEFDGKSLGSISAADTLTYEVARQTKDREIRTALGDELYVIWLKRTNPPFLEVALVAGQQKLPVDAALHIWEIKESLSLRGSELEAQAGLSPEQRKSAMVVPILQARADVEALVGRDAMLRGWNDAFRWLGAKPETLGN